MSDDIYHIMDRIGVSMLGELLKEKIFLSSPHMSEEGYEMEYIREAFESNWIAPWERTWMSLKMKCAVCSV